jgi:MFS family permease
MGDWGGAGGASGMSWALASVVAPAHCTASLGSIQNFGGYLGGALTPTVSGFIVQATGTFVPALLVTAVIALASAVATRGNPEPAYPVGRARGSRTVGTAKWRVLVTAGALAGDRTNGDSSKARFAPDSPLEGAGGWLPGCARHRTWSET